MNGNKVSVLSEKPETWRRIRRTPVPPRPSSDRPHPEPRPHLRRGPVTSVHTTASPWRDSDPLGSPGVRTGHAGTALGGFLGTVT